MKILFPDGHMEEITEIYTTIEEIILHLGLNPLEYLISREGEIIPEDTPAQGIDTVRLIRISHGG